MIRNLLIGKELIESRNEYKYALLRAQLGLLLAAICLIYVFIDTLSSVYVFLPWYTVGIIFSALVIYLNRQRKYLLSSTLLLITANLLVFLFTSTENLQGGSFFYFVAASATSLVVFNPINKSLGVFFVGVSIFLAAIAYFGDGLPIEAPVENQEYQQISFTVNFLLGLLSSVLILKFVMKRNEESEKTLIRNKEELEQLTKELQISRNRFSLAVDGTKAGIYEWDLATNKVYVSTRFKELVGLKEIEAEDINSHFLRSMIHKEDLETYEKVVSEAIIGESSYQVEVRIKVDADNYRWFLDSAIVSLQDGLPEVAVGSIIDIDDRKRAENDLIANNAELIKTNKELDRFVYSASHDMRAPLSTLLGLLNLAKLTDNLDEIEHYHDLMSNRIQTMEGFIKEITDYSRNARLEVTLEDINIYDLVTEVKNSFQFLAEEARVEFKIDIDPKFTMKSDQRRLRVVLNNLVSNAIKYCDSTKERRYVRIKVYQENSDCIIKVLDNGIGIDEKYMAHIFDMFFRASDRSNGSGLGLYIVRETLDRLNAQITCRSEEQIGSTFEVSIPASELREVA